MFCPICESMVSATGNLHTAYRDDGTKYEYEDYLCEQCGWETEVEIEPENDEVDVACNDCEYYIDNDCDNPNSNYYGKNVDGIKVCCSFFK